MTNSTLALILFTLTASVTFATEFEWHISPAGSDQADGTDEQPFATLSQAVNALRAKREQNPESTHTIIAHQGLYCFDQTLDLTRLESGSKENPTLITSFADDQVIFSGGVTVGGWQKQEGAVFRSNLNNTGLTHIKPFTQLLFKGRRMTLARYPNFDSDNPYAGGFAYVAGEHLPMYLECDSDRKDRFTAKSQDIHQWSRPEEMLISIFARYNWWNNIIPVKSVDPADAAITLSKNASYAIRPDDRYFIMNAREELDAPGEWWYDKASRELYFIPPSPITSDQDVSVAQVDTIIRINPETANIRIRGITFECCEKNSIMIDKATNCVVEKCVIRDTGFNTASGISISDGENCGVFGCTISGTAQHGIDISGGDRITLTSAGHFAVNNHCHHTGAYVKRGVGVYANGVGCRIAHNWCHDMPRMGIQFAGNNHLIEYNRLNHLSLEIDDTAAIYTGGRNWLDSRGSIIRYNHISDVKGFGWDTLKKKYTSPHFSWGIYLDDNTGGVDVYGNIVEGSFSGALHLHSSRDNHIWNNVFANSIEQQIQISGWTADGRWLRHLDQMIKGYESVEGQPGWKEMRNMQMHPTNSILPDQTVMLGNRIINNIIYYPDHPESRYVKMRSFNFQANLIDSNILWTAGAPIITPYNQYAPEKPGSTNIIRNAGFSDGQNKGVPQNWHWTSKPLPESKVAVSQDPDNRENLCVQLFGSLNPDKGWDKYPGIISDTLTLKPGTWYQVTARVRSDKPYPLDPLTIFSYKKDTYYWRTTAQPITLSNEWTEYANAFQIPAKGDQDYNEQMASFQARIRFENADGWVMVDDLCVAECQEPDSWRSWQKMGADQNSIIADPLFIDPSSGNFQLKPESPALKLNFKQIPTEKIGQYEHPLRAL